MKFDMRTQLTTLSVYIRSILEGFLCDLTALMILTEVEGN